MGRRVIFALLLALGLAAEKPAPVTKAPRKIQSPEPEYTEEARAKRIEGSVLLKGEIGTDGRVTNIRLARGLGHGLDQKAVECLRKWQFAPATRQGEPVTVQANFEINFRLLR